MEEYPIIDISDQIVDDFEQMGTKSKFWYTDSNDGYEYIFKSTHTLDKKGNPVIRKGEDWSEKIACELARELGIPHAHYDLASYKGERGTRSPNFIKEGENMVFGNQLLQRTATSLRTPIDKGERAQRVDMIGAILERIVENPPKGWNPTENIKDAEDVFVGYVMFDTLISNQDRHSQNWGMIEDLDGTAFLSPSFDHGASLGRNESDETRLERLKSKDKGRWVPYYVTKCKSYFYADHKRLKTFESFIFFSSFKPNASLEWIERLEALDQQKIKDIIEAVPSEVMGDIAKYFCLAIILVNRERIIRNGKKIVETIKTERRKRKRATQ